jgi:RimJ/RimL family protein N-acetyltransferase
MLLDDVWPLFALRLRTPRIEMRLVRDDDLAGLVDAALAGIHDPERMPFSAPWTDAPADPLARDFAAFHWARRAAVRRETWGISFAVLEGGVPIGVQDVSAHDFGTTRAISSGSWLTASAQGRGLGTEMRAALLLFAFDHLGAERAESGAASWNDRSRGVSAKLGYREDGTEWHRVRDERVEVQRYVLDRDAFRRPDWELQVDGAARAIAELTDYRVPVAAERPEGSTP